MFQSCFGFAGLRKSLLSHFAWPLACNLSFRLSLCAPYLYLVGSRVRWLSMQVSVRCLPSPRDGDSRLWLLGFPLHLRVFACPRRVRFGILEGVPHISSYNVRCRRCFKNALSPTPELVGAHISPMFDLPVCRSKENEQASSPSSLQILACDYRISFAFAFSLESLFNRLVAVRSLRRHIPGLKHAS